MTSFKRDLKIEAFLNVYCNTCWYELLQSGVFGFVFSFVGVRKSNDRVWHEKVELIDRGFLFLQLLLDRLRFVRNMRAKCASFRFKMKLRIFKGS